MALGDPSGLECWGNIISVDLGVFYGGWGHAEGLFEMSSFKLLSRLRCCRFVVAKPPTAPTPLFK